MPATKRPAKPKPPPDPTKFAREVAGTYHSGDGRFLLHQDHGGKWYATDSEQTNELGLELVLGPFATIAEAKEAVATQREHPHGASPGAKVRSLVLGERKVTAAKTPPDRGRPALAPSLTATPKPAPAPKAKIEPKAQTTVEPEITATTPARRPKTARAPEPEQPEFDYRPATWKPTGDDRDAVAGALRRINDAWTSGEPQDARDFLDQSVVFVQPDFAGRTEGRAAAIESYRAFMAAARLHAYAETDLTIDLRGHAAVATYRWQMDYSIGGKRLVETGRDLFVFNRAGTRWVAVWRVLLPEPPAASG